MGGIEKPPPPAAFFPHPREERRSDAATAVSAQERSIDLPVIIFLFLSMIITL